MGNCARLRVKRFEVCALVITVSVLSQCLSEFDYHIFLVQETTDASDLTMGKVICGNPSKALLSRRRLNPDASGDLDNPAPEFTFQPKVSEEMCFYSFKSIVRNYYHSIMSANFQIHRTLTLKVLMDIILCL